MFRSSVLLLVVKNILAKLFHLTMASLCRLPQRSYIDVVVIVGVFVCLLRKISHLCIVSDEVYADIRAWT